MKVSESVTRIIERAEKADVSPDTTVWWQRENDCCRASLAGAYGHEEISARFPTGFVVLAPTNLARFFPVPFYNALLAVDKLRLGRLEAFAAQMPKTDSIRPNDVRKIWPLEGLVQRSYFRGKEGFTEHLASLRRLVDALTDLDL